MPKALENPVVDGKKLCTVCGEYKAIDQFYAEKRAVSGLRSDCIDCMNTRRQKAYIERFSEQEKSRAEENRRKRKEQISQAYGGQCACCAITDIRLLSVDHIDGKGRQHRQELNIQGGSAFYDWVKRENFPDKLQVLCHNCNKSYGNYGYCPHTGATAPEPKNYDARKRIELRTAAFTSYGNKCSNCSCTIQEFLTIHHKLGGGSKHRESLPGGTMGFYRFLRDNNYPPDYELLCANCHQCLTRSDELPTS